MNKLILFAFLLTGFAATAQTRTSAPIVLAKGQNIKVSSTNTSDADMGMGMQMKNNSTSTSIITVTGENEKEYTVTNTLTKLKTTIEEMGRTHEYDSEKESDKDSEIGKLLSEAIGKPIIVTVNKASGTSTMDKMNEGPEKPEKNGMEGLMEAFSGGGSDPAVSGAFLLIPAGKKAGDSWVITDSTKEKKEVKTFTINSINKNIATVTFKTVTDANNTLEVQGNQMDVTINTKSSGEIIADIRTGLVNNRESESDITGNLEIMGQSMPISAKSKLVSVYTIVQD